MFNEELYKNLEENFGVERMRSFAEIMAVRHDILFNDSEEALNGEDFERDWWVEKFIELSDIPKDPLTEVIEAIERIKRTLRTKGYTNILDVKNHNDFEDEDLRLRETDQQRL